jgi:hypothetical protein
MSAIEITTFTLRDCSAAQFIAANADLDVWLRRQPGFRSRSIAERADGVILDVLVWDSAAQAEASTARLMDELRDSPAHALIDQRSVAWSVAPVLHAGSVAGTSADTTGGPDSTTIRMPQPCAALRTIGSSWFIPPPCSCHQKRSL